MTVYVQFIWQLFLFKAYCNFKGAHAAIYLSGTTIFSGSHLQRPSIFKGTVFVVLSRVLGNGSFSIIKEHLQPQILSNLLYFFRTGGVAARRYHSHQL